MNVCLSNTGSKAGSRVSPNSSKRTGIPIRMLFSNVRKKEESKEEYSYLSEELSQTLAASGHI